MIAPAFASPSSSDTPLLTEDQARVLQRITALAQLHFDGVGSECAIAPRLWPLIVGPTGCGKSYLCRLLAAETRAHYMHLSYGEWIVQGARSTCTAFTIIEAALRYPRVIVHLDELDKLPVNAEQEWSRAVTNEIWGVLDGELPIRRFVIDADVRARHSADRLLKLSDRGASERIFIVGSGTWQEIFDHSRSSAHRPLGFGAAGTEQSAAADGAFRNAASEVSATTGPMAELLARFEGELQLIRPPSIAEALALLAHTGARAYAREIRFDEARLLQTLIPRQGYRALQSVVTELMLRGWRPRSSSVAPVELESPPAANTDAQTEFTF